MKTQKPKTEQPLLLSSYLTQTATDLIMIMIVCQDICWVAGGMSVTP